MHGERAASNTPRQTRVTSKPGKLNVVAYPDMRALAGDANAHRRCSPSEPNIVPSKALRTRTICEGDKAWTGAQRAQGTKPTYIVAEHRLIESLNHAVTYVGEVEGGIYPIKQDASGISMQDILREALQSGIPQIDSV